MRVQLSRRKGARIPPGTVVVSRPSVWGNPFDWRTYGAKLAVELYAGAIAAADGGEWPWLDSAIIRRELAGRPLACWCPPGACCHADVLLAIANDNTPPLQAAYAAYRRAWRAEFKAWTDAGRP